MKNFFSFFQNKSQKSVTGNISKRQYVDRGSVQYEKYSKMELRTAIKAYNTYIRYIKGDIRLIDCAKELSVTNPQRCHTIFSHSLSILTEEKVLLISSIESNKY